MVRGTLQSLPGVTKAEVSREKGEAIIEYDPSQVAPQKMATEIKEKCGVSVTDFQAPPSGR